jgi:phosphoribosyl-ATP pyrophosphohydrolase
VSGYHVRKIKKGVIGTVSKIREEANELRDADEQGVKILILCEVADLVGAIEHYLEQNFPDFTIQDAQVMARLTRVHKEGK